MLLYLKKIVFMPESICNDQAQNKQHTGKDCPPPHKSRDGQFPNTGNLTCEESIKVNVALKVSKIIVALFQCRTIFYFLVLLLQLFSQIDITED